MSIAVKDPSFCPDMARWLKSLVFLVAIDEQTGQYTPSLSTIASWVQDFDGWYKDSIGCNYGQQLHRLYHRDMTLVGPDLTHFAEEICALSEVTASCGFGFSITIPLDQACDDLENFLLLAQCKSVSSIGIGVNPEATDLEQCKIDEVLASVVQSNGHIAFVGDNKVIAAMGLLDHVDVQSTQITVHPKDPALNFKKPKAAVKRCFSRLRVYVDPVGDIYPCLGLIGFEQAKLGSIFEDIKQTAFLERPYPMSIDALARHGPTLTKPEPTEKLSNLPWVCERHRMEFLDSNDT